MGRVENRVALVTGGATGLGRSHALALAREGADVAIFDLGDGHRDAEPGYPLATQAELDRTVEEIRAIGRRAIGITGDVRNQADLDEAAARTVDELGGIDILVANAGVAMMGAPWEMSREDWDLLVGTNLTGVWQSTKAVIPHMIERRYGRIVLKSSCMGYRPVSWLGPYVATKRGVIALAECLAIDLGQYGITCNAICPSTVDSGTNRGLALRHGLDWDGLARDWVKTQAIHELAEPHDISAGVVYLASDDARYVTGVALSVDAGTSVL